MNSQNFKEFTDKTTMAETARGNIIDKLKSLEWMWGIDKVKYQEFEFEVMDMTMAVAVMQLCFSKERIALDKTFTITYDDNKNQTKSVTKANWEVTIKEVTAADAKATTELQLLEDQGLLDAMEANVKLYQTYLNGYKRYGEVLRTMLIQEMADNKRAEAAMNIQDRYNEIWADLI